MGEKLKSGGRLKLKRISAGLVGAKHNAHRPFLHPWLTVIQDHSGGARFYAGRFARAFFLATVFVAPQAYAQNARVIRDDAGGNMNTYLMAASAARAFGQRIEIDGWCASACTLYLGSPYTCVTRRAELAFHAPTGGSPSQKRLAVRVMSEKLPQAVGRWFLQYAAHLTGKAYLKLSANQLVQMGAARYC